MSFAETVQTFVLQQQISDVQLYDANILAGVLAFGVIAFTLLFLISAPYGKFVGQKDKVGFLRWIFGPVVNGRIGFCLQELPSSVTFLATTLYCLLQDKPMEFFSVVRVLSFSMFIFHYIHRAFIYPFRAPSINDSTLLVCALAFTYTSINGYLNAKFTFIYGDSTPFSGQTTVDKIRIVAGVILFITGFSINFDSDSRLFALRRRKEGNAAKKAYYIPEGGMFSFVSAANYFGEMVEWVGYAICVNNCAAWSFVAFTVMNLLPRGVSAHKWYLNHFGEKYPKNRKAIIPFLW